jgi:hypothetical protein
MRVGNSGMRQGNSKASRGIVRNAGRGVDFANSKYLFPAGPGQKNIVRIKYTGFRKRDFGAANEAAGIRTGRTGGFTQTPPSGYTWHHLDDYDPTTGEGTMQLVQTTIHKAISHAGGVAQYQAAHGVGYR